MVSVMMPMHDALSYFYSYFRLLHAELSISFGALLDFIAPALAAQGMRMNTSDT